MPPTLPVPVPEPPPDAGRATRRGQVGLSTWSFGAEGRAVVLVPAWVEPTQKLPLLLALHGRGEALKGPDKGVMGWPEDYALVRAIQRVCAPPLTSDDLEGFVDPKRLTAHNDDLAKRPFGGMVVVCPYSPDVELRKPAAIARYAEHVMKEVLPRARAELPVLAATAATGIDGVSLGGALALRIGLGNPEAFGVVGSLQAAIGEDQVADFAGLVKRAREKNPAQKLRLLTSDKDYFRSAIQKTSAALRDAGLAHEFTEVPGPHDYPFNRGPGALEMLLWHDRALARG